MRVGEGGTGLGIVCPSPRNMKSCAINDVACSRKSCRTEITAFQYVFL